jgi:Cytochrome c oxidase subunit IV
MKVEGWLFLGCGIFFGGADIVYWYTSKEVTGTAALAFAVGLALLTGFYVLFTGRRLPKRPEDDNVGEVEQGTGEVGFFSPHSWQPLSLAVGGAFAFLSVAIGWWLLYFSVPVILVGLYGWVFEYYRGENRTQ